MFSSHPLTLLRTGRTASKSCSSTYFLLRLLRFTRSLATAASGPKALVTHSMMPPRMPKFVTPCLDRIGPRSLDRSGTVEVLSFDDMAGKNEAVTPKMLSCTYSSLVAVDLLWSKKGRTVVMSAARMEGSTLSRSEPTSSHMSHRIVSCREERVPDDAVPSPRRLDMAVTTSPR